MTSSPPRTFTYLAPTEVEELARRTNPRDLTVTGIGASGYSRVTRILGNNVYAGPFDGTWNTPLLLVMWQRLTPAGSAALEQLGLDNATKIV